MIKQIYFFSRLGFNKRSKRVFNYIAEKLLNFIIPKYYKLYRSNKKGINKKQIREKKIIVSLTSIPPRMDSLWLCIEALLRQSYKPDRIVLWLGNSQFDNVEIPKQLLELKERGLEIEFCDDVKSHTKYYYAFKYFYDEVIITVDDDIFYPENMIEDLMDSYKKNPNVISCHRAHLVRFSKEGSLRRYVDWDLTAPGKIGPSNQLIQTGVGGVLYPPNSLYGDLLDKSLIFDLCPKADDIWLKIMALLNHTKIKKVKPDSYRPLEIKNTQKIALCQYNVDKNQNDIQLCKILEYYDLRPDIFRDKQE